jgi:hypothetical protein
MVDNDSTWKEEVMRQHGIPAAGLNRDLLVARPANRWPLLANGTQYSPVRMRKSSWLGSHNAISNKEQKMSTISNTVAKVPPAITADDPRRNLVVENPDNSNALHLGVVGDTYTILLSGMRQCLIDLYCKVGETISRKTEGAEWGWRGSTTSPVHRNEELMPNKHSKRAPYTFVF